MTKWRLQLARPIPASPVADQWQSWIDRAYRLILRRFGAVEYAALDPELVDDVVLMAVTEHARAWRDTTANKYSVAIDDGSVTRSYESSVGLLSIPDELWALLDGEEVPSASFTIAPVAP